eukprot:gnl/TRDRNA2_/TRDRNA2_49505_c0_seq1.p2 gnl/TRDRNA2_/TRDRNA2_49505_c0~~gnl/TRDRNA2_/TRDRNA2_49505_c0_seq1.p2  ORF type:complete len:176 (+),score=29.91 gnl/TRDRNA2_/TRDRNA2_49505_c0_seq1:391-918(+)
MKAAEQLIGDFKPQGLSNTSWAFAKARQSDVQLCKNLARAAELRIASFNAHKLDMIVWATSRLDSMKDAWSLFDHGKHAGILLSPACFQAPFMECEQRGFFEHEIRLLQGLEDMADKHGVDGFLGAATKRVAATRLLKATATKKTSDSDCLLGEVCACLWCSCCDQELLPHPLDI